MLNNLSQCFLNEHLRDNHFKNTSKNIIKRILRVCLTIILKNIFDLKSVLKKNQVFEKYLENTFKDLKNYLQC